MSRLLTKSEMAELIQVSEKTLDRWVAAGVIPLAVAEGGIQRFNAEAVKRALAKRAREQRKPKVKPSTHAMVI